MDLGVTPLRHEEVVEAVGRYQEADPPEGVHCPAELRVRPDRGVEPQLVSWKTHHGHPRPDLELLEAQGPLDDEEVFRERTKGGKLAHGCSSSGTPEDCTSSACATCWSL